MVKMRGTRPCVFCTKGFIITGYVCNLNDWLNGERLQKHVSSVFCLLSVFIIYLPLLCLLFIFASFIYHLSCIDPLSIYLSSINLSITSLSIHHLIRLIWWDIFIDQTKKSRRRSRLEWAVKEFHTGGGGGLGSRETQVKLGRCLNFTAEVAEGVTANTAVKDSLS